MKRTTCTLLLFAGLMSCSSDPKTDAQRYCDCVQENGSSTDRICLEILQELQDKYAFSPEDAETLVLEIQACKKTIEK